LVTPFGLSATHLNDTVETLNFCQQSDFSGAVFHDLDDDPGSKDFIASLKKAAPQLFCVAVVNTSPEPLKEEALHMGYNDFIYKPFHQLDILCTLANIADKKRKPRK